MIGTFTRRSLLAGATAGLVLSPGLRALLGAGSDRPFRLGACDWSLGKRQDIEVFAAAEEVGLDGVEVTFDGDSSTGLLSEAVRQQYLAEAKKRGLSICSMAIGGLNQIPYASDPKAEMWVEESIDVMVKLGLQVALVPFFMRGEIKGDDALQATVIARLKKVAPKAEKAGVTLALETALNAEEHMRILDAVGSPAVKVYYDVSNMLRRGNDIYREIPQLGPRIARVHLKEKGCLLGQGDVDFVRVRKALESIGYHDWLVIEEAKVKGRSVVDCYHDNVKFVRSVFGLSDKAPGKRGPT